MSTDGKVYSLSILTYLTELWFSLYEVSDAHLWENIKITDFDALYEKVGCQFGAHRDIYAVRN
jgi:hypothetical protein